MPKIKLTQIQIEDECSKHGFIFTGIYINIDTAFECICPCGNSTKKTLGNIRKGQTCRKCKGLDSPIQSELENKFKEHGYKLLSVYKNCKDPLDYKCSCGNISKISYSNFRKGQQCSECAILKRSKENHWNWNPDREYMKLSKQIKDRSHLLVKRCLQYTGGKKNKYTEEILGYTKKELLEHLQTHINWERVKNTVWHIDHIFPMAIFIKYGIFDPKIINSLDNLQPLEASENCSKQDECDEIEFIEYLKTKNINMELIK